jgi:mannitol operon repressor
VIRRFEEAHPHLRDFRDYLAALRKESDRGAALISTAMIDEQLKKCVQARLLDDDRVERLLCGFSAPIGTMSARCLTAFLLGTISEEEFSDIAVLRNIRNRFAHDLRVSFTDASVIGQCKKLTFAARDYEGVTLDARDQFMTAASALILNLTNRPHYVAQVRLSYQKWEY